MPYSTRCSVDEGPKDILRTESRGMGKFRNWGREGKRTWIHQRVILIGNYKKNLVMPKFGDHGFPSKNS